ncbi:MAG: LpxI family protein [Maricaulaceae bacterium]
MGVQRLEPSLAVGSGHLAGPPLRDQDHRDMAVASAAAAAIGAIDAGQGAIVADGLVLALEAQEGTDAMLGRIPSLSPVVRGAPGDRRGVLVKRPKSRQDRRVDLPVIGPRTIDLAHQAGLAGVAVETGGALVVDRPQTLERCRDRAVFLFGFAPDGP